MEEICFFLRRHHEPTYPTKAAHSSAPTEVIQAACDLYGLSSQGIASMQAEHFSAHIPFLWVIRLNEHASALVIALPGESKTLVAAPWLEETD